MSQDFTFRQAMKPNVLKSPSGLMLVVAVVGGTIWCWMSAGSTWTPLILSRSLFHPPLLYVSCWFTDLGILLERIRLGLKLTSPTLSPRDGTLMRVISLYVHIMFGDWASRAGFNITFPPFTSTFSLKLDSMTLLLAHWIPLKTYT